MKTLTASSLLLLLLGGGCCCVGVVHSWIMRPTLASSSSSFSTILAKTTSRFLPAKATTAAKHVVVVVEESSIPFTTESSSEEQIQASFSSSNNNNNNNNKKKKKRRVAVLVCPAQFCVPKDYTVLLENLEHHFSHAGAFNDIEEEEEEEKLISISTSSRTTPLSRTDWIQVAKQLPTKEFFQSNLSVAVTLDWYFAKMEQGLAEIFAHEQESSKNDNDDDDDDDDWSLCIIGHSIGGWVARAYLGGMSRSSTAVHRMALEKCSSLITLGTPHLSSPPDNDNNNNNNNNNGLARLLDQTRGLLRSIAQESSCSPQSLLDNHGIETTCVCGQGLEANLWTSNPEELLALGSYLPLLGRLSTKMDDGSTNTGKNVIAGDGIVPIQVAFLESPARQVLLDTCPRTNQAVRHAHVIPTPWNLWDGTAPSIALNQDEYPSYVSQSIVGQWARYIQ